MSANGRRSLVANAMYCDQPGLFVYKFPPDPLRPWKKQVVQIGHSAEGTAAGDLDGDGKEEIVSGPYWYSAPRAGAFSGQAWKLHSLAPDFREMCRVALIDVNGNGRLDAVLVEDEYPDGRLAWFENRFEDHDGAKVVELNPGRLSIISHGWAEPRYVHIWELGTTP